MTATDVVPPSAAEPEKPNTLERIIGVFANPGPTFESIVKRPDILVPLLIFVLISVVSSIAIATKVDFTAMAREAIESNPNVPPDRVESSVNITRTIMKVTMYASPVVTILILLITAGICLVAFRMFGGEGDFMTAFSVTTYAWFPRLVRGILGVIVMFTKSSLSIYDLQNPVMSNLGFLFDPKTSPVGYALGSAIDIFNLWSLVLLIIGFATMSKLSRAKSATIVIVFWVIVNLFTLIGPLMQAARARS